MKALIAVKRVVDFAVKVRVAPGNKAVDTANTKMSINPFCEIAVEEAVRLKEKGALSELIAVSAGPDKAQETLRQALAMGADRGILLKTDLRVDQELEPLLVAKLLMQIVLKENPMLVFLGKQAIDDDNNQVGQILAGLLSWPQATSASKVVMNKGMTSIEVTREVDDGLETIGVELPAVVTCDLRLNEPRYATLPNIMKAKKKPLEVIDANSLGVEMKPRIETLRVEEPMKREAGVMVKSVDELLEKLKNAGVVNL